MTTTPANVGDVTEVGKLLHGLEQTVYADAGYQGAEKRTPKRGRTWYIAAKRGSVKAMPEGDLKDAVKHTEHMKAAVRSKVEYPFRVVKQQFGYAVATERAVVKQQFGYAVATERAFRDPAADLRDTLPARQPQNYPTIIDPAQVGELMRAIDSFTGTFVVHCALKLAPSWFCRPGEIRQAEWRNSI